MAELVAALTRALHRRSAAKSVIVVPLAADALGVIPQDLALCLYRITQEAVRKSPRMRARARCTSP